MLIKSQDRLLFEGLSLTIYVHVNTLVYMTLLALEESPNVHCEDFPSLKYFKEIFDCSP